MATEQQTEAKIEWEKQTRERYSEEPDGPASPDKATEEPEDGGEPEEAAKAAEEDEEPPPSSKRPAPPAANKGAPKASLAALAGMPEGTSDVAARTAIARGMTVYEHAARLTGTADHQQVIGHLDAMARDAAEVGRLRNERNAAVQKANARERLDLLHRLEASGAHTRGELFVDVIENGKRVGVKPAKFWGPGPEGRTLANLRGYVAQRLDNAAPAVKASPFEPKTPTAAAHITEQDREIAARNGFDPERVAASRAALFGTNSAPARGV